MEYKKNFSLAEHTTWKIGGCADWCVQPQSVEELQQACVWAKNQALPITVVSGGSNILVSDRGIEGLVLLLNQFHQITNVEYTQNQLRVECLSGTPKAELLKIFVKHRLSPALFLAGLPGDVGGGIVMNAGVGHDIQPKEFVDIVESFEFIPFSDPNNIVKKDKTDVQWNYRHCDGWGPGVISKVNIVWNEQSREDLLPRLQESNKRRMTSQPLQWPSCGSTFKNPSGAKAGFLIDSCGLKNYQVGGAQVSDLHANFILNRGGASADDVLAVVEHIQNTIYQKHGIHLEKEFRYLGRK